MVATGQGRYMLDTCVCIEILRGHIGSRRLPDLASCMLSSIVTAELRTGLAKEPGNPQRAAKLQEFISLFPVAGFDDAAASKYARIRADLEGRGMSIGPLDLLVAAHACQLGATLITTNAKEFRRVDGLRLLDWK